MFSKDCKRKLDENRRLQGSTKGTFEPQNDQFDRAPLIKICGVESETEDTEHSLVQTLTLYNLTLEDSGLYTCRASTPDGGRPDTKRRHLEVFPLVAPRVMDTNMNGTTVSLRWRWGTNSSDFQRLNRLVVIELVLHSLELAQVLVCH